MRRHEQKRRSRSRPLPAHPRGRGFTLLELLIVVAVIGIIVALILTAAQAGVRRSEERATQALITKLESGMTIRIDALSAMQFDANDAHASLATAFTGTASIPSNQRAQAIARFDLMKAELPDVFLVQSDANYPLNFGAAPFPVGAGTAWPAYVGGSATATHCQYMLPFGVGMTDAPGAATPSFGATSATFAPPVTGIFGASFTAASGIYKNLVAAAVKNGATAPTPANIGYDGVDNNNDGLIDNITENGASVVSGVTALLANHTHKTARSEMLYALLVEGQGPLGTVFNADDFNDREVRDTDGDGLPEFVDAWGEPLQFYRWPIFYPTDSMKGAREYAVSQTMGSVFYSVETRQQYPLDTAQKLLDPLWWSGGVGTFAANTSSPFAAVQTPLSGSAFTFQTLFTTLTDPNAQAAGILPSQLWSRGDLNWPARRAYYSRFLILSGGPDKLPGVPVFDQSWYRRLNSNYGLSLATTPAFAGSSPVGVPTDVVSTDKYIGNIYYLRVEGQAAKATYQRSDYNVYYTFAPGGTATAYDNLLNSTSPIYDGGSDDISNLNLQGPGGATQ
jgi:prepilin-type N-terminal cleavage/methylation domain-containing protein